jgi:hypothetical protein
MCLLAIGTRTDAVPMTITADHAETIVRAQPVNGEVPVPARLSVVKVERCEHGYIVRHLLSEGWTNPYNDIYNPSIWCNGAG